MKTKLLLVLALTIATTICSLQKAVAQSWILTGNNNAKDTSKLGTTNSIPLRIFTNNKERIRITIGGSVGIGVISPLQKLDVNGNINIAANSGLYIGNKRIISNKGTGNFFAGEDAGINNTADDNTAVGWQSLLYNTTGVENTSCGALALYANNIGNNCTAIGAQALFTNTTGDDNTAVGLNSLYNNTGGYFNTALGAAALYKNTYGTENTAIGVESLLTPTIGGGNTAIGAYADVRDSTFYSTAIGYQAMATAGNQIMLGNSWLSTVRTYGSIIWASDGRFKRNIKENVPGLEFIKQLRPVTYNYDIHKLNNYINNKQHIKSRDEEAIVNKEKKFYTGFVAQEVEAAANKLHYDFSGVYKPENDKDVYGLSYSDFVVPLVKAVQELSKQNDSIINENEIFKSRLDKIEQMLSSNNLKQNSVANAVDLSSATLNQNMPNPFSQTTIIKYHVQINTTRANISITDMNGKLIKSFSITPNDNGKLIIQAGELAAGIYNYALTVNGKLIDTKKMELIK